jgi:hypothetical protein
VSPPADTGNETRSSTGDSRSGVPK